MSSKSGESAKRLEHGKKIIDQTINALKFDKPRDKKSVIVDSLVDPDVGLITDDNKKYTQTDYLSKDKGENDKLQKLYHAILKKKKIINVLSERFTDIFGGDIKTYPITKDSKEKEIKCNITFIKNLEKDITLQCDFNAILNKIEFVITKKIGGKDKMLYRSVYRLSDTKWVDGKIESGRIIFRPFYKEGETEAGYSTPFCKSYTRFIRGAPRTKTKEVTIKSSTMREQDVRNISRLQSLDENDKYKIIKFTELVQRRIKDEEKLGEEDTLAFKDAREKCYKELEKQHFKIDPIDPIFNGYISSKLKYLAHHTNGELYNSKVEGYACIKDLYYILPFTLYDIITSGWGIYNDDKGKKESILDILEITNLNLKMWYDDIEQFKSTVITFISLYSHIKIQESININLTESERRDFGRFFEVAKTTNKSSMKPITIEKNKNSNFILSLESGKKVLVTNYITKDIISALKSNIEKISEEFESYINSILINNSLILPKVFIDGETTAFGSSNPLKMLTVNEGKQDTDLTLLKNAVESSDSDKIGAIYTQLTNREESYEDEKFEEQDYEDEEYDEAYVAKEGSWAARAAAATALPEPERPKPEPKETAKPVAITFPELESSDRPPAPRGYVPSSREVERKPKVYSDESSSSKPGARRVVGDKSIKYDSDRLKEPLGNLLREPLAEYRKKQTISVQSNKEYKRMDPVELKDTLIKNWGQEKYNRIFIGDELYSLLVKYLQCIKDGIKEEKSYISDYRTLKTFFEAKAVSSYVHVIEEALKDIDKMHLGNHCLENIQESILKEFAKTQPRKLLYDLIFYDMGTFNMAHIDKIKLSKSTKDIELALKFKLTKILIKIYEIKGKSQKSLDEDIAYIYNKMLSEELSLEEALEHLEGKAKEDIDKAKEIERRKAEFNNSKSPAFRFSTKEKDAIARLMVEKNPEMKKSYTFEEAVEKVFEGDKSKHSKGKGHREKYLKYKNKYLELKEKLGL